MIKTLVCEDCQKVFSANTENVNECRMVFDVQCTCGSYEVNLHDSEPTQQILPIHLRHLR